ncbi:MAG: peptidase M16, partial [Gammaproteobacteria bacterium]|nr:peptidase M16 [Gammaproteobacteria bacterium]NIT62337.1 peptidase M16 [Gammaproteobacteria bacterium]NIV19279.1 peptidase M16 [Gammaproteobacteria bacterium]NIY30917.1 peptidase M16 [Gammaproteobacteria bacterium]
EALVRERFAAVKNRGLEAPTYPAEYLAPQQGLRVLRVEPVTDQRLLTLHFPLPSLHAHDAAKPLRVIGAILGHEGEGSLLSLLKAEGLATSLSAGGGEQTEDYAAFEITVGLTDAGLERFHDVARLALGAVRGLERAGVPRHLYEEYGRMAALEYRFREVPAAGSHARHLS